jgi:hypothetical protein
MGPARRTTVQRQDLRGYLVMKYYVSFWFTVLVILQNNA